MIYVKELTRSEGMQLQRILRSSKNRIKVKRAYVILASSQGMAVPEIAELYHFSEKYVRQLIHNFDSDGLESLKPKYCNCGREKVFTEEQRSMIVDLVLMPPQVIGLPFTRWSLSKLREEAIQRGYVKSISLETLRQVLRNAKVRVRRTKTWKESNDPEFESKKSASGSSMPPLCPEDEESA